MMLSAGYGVHVGSSLVLGVRFMSQVVGMRSARTGLGSHRQRRSHGAGVRCGHRSRALSRLTDRDAVLAVAFSPDAARVTTASHKGAAHLMVIDTAVLIARQLNVARSPNSPLRRTVAMPKDQSLA